MWRMAWRYLRFHAKNTTLLVLAISVSCALFLVTNILWAELKGELRARARGTPLVLGARGSRIDLVLHALYFQTAPPGTISMKDLDDVRATGWADAIPLDARFRTRSHPLVGTSIDYFAWRGLEVARGHLFTRLGDCVVGARVAARRRLRAGDHLLTDAQGSLIDLLKYPLRLRVTGVLAPTGSVDDEAVFCDIRTIWILEGIGHGHEDLARASPGDPAVLQRREGEVVASSAIKQYFEITDENFDSFHFHGDPATFPTSAALIIPKGSSARRPESAVTLLLGRYQDHATLQMVVPSRVVDQLLAAVFRIKRWLDAAALAVGLSTLLWIVLTVMLSLRLRADEFTTLFRIGCPRRTTARLVAAELFLIALACMLILVPFALLAAWLGPDLIRHSL